MAVCAREINAVFHIFKNNAPDRFDTRLALFFAFKKRHPSCVPPPAKQVHYETRRLKNLTLVLPFIVNVDPATSPASQF